MDVLICVYILKRDGCCGLQRGRAPRHFTLAARKRSIYTCVCVCVWTYCFIFRGL